MNEYKNKLVIIGNGFDLAHGLKTSYNDFVNWYLEQTLNTIGNHNFYYEDKIISYRFKYKGHQMNDLVENSKLSLVDWFLNEIKNPQFIEVSKISPLLERLIHQSIEYRWVDIEGEFYNLLISTFEKGKMQSRKWLIGEIIELNAQFEFMKNNLEEYLYSLNYIMFKSNQDINSLFSDDYLAGYNNESKDPKQVHYLNFRICFEIGGAKIMEF